MSHRRTRSLGHRLGVVQTYVILELFAFARFNEILASAIMSAPILVSIGSRARARDASPNREARLKSTSEENPRVF